MAKRDREHKTKTIGNLQQAPIFIRTMLQRQKQDFHDPGMADDAAGMKPVFAAFFDNTGNGTDDAVLKI